MQFTAVNRPIKMLGPIVLLRVKKPDQVSIGQLAVGAVRFEAVARGTSKTQIAKIRLTIPCGRKDVFDLELVA